MINTFIWQKFNKIHEGQEGSFLKFRWFYMEWPCYFSFWANFFLFTTSPKNWKLKKKKKKKKKMSQGNTQVHQKSWSYSETWHTTEVIVIFHSGLFFALLPCNSPKIENFKKLKKIPEAIIILPKCTKKHDHMLYCCWDMARDKSNYSFSFQAIFCCFFTP